MEVDTAAVKAARQNALARGKTNGEFVAGRVEDLLPGMLARFEAGASTLLLDPPRTGCLPEMLRLLTEVQPAQILYVSCHPATLARDLNVLCTQGVFELSRIIPLDMFPQTQHVECVADLRKKGVPPSQA
jgi:23S rRNA (uracil1939-C5)-methyltransferase